MVSPLVTVIILLIIIVATNYGIQPTAKDAIDSFPKHKITKFSRDPGLKILVAPDIQDIRDVFNGTSIQNSLAFVADGTKMVEEYRKNRDDYYAGIEFGFNDTMPKHVRYKLRFPYNKAPATDGRRRRVDGCYQEDGLGNCLANDFLRLGFLTLQATIDEALLKYWQNQGELPESSNWTIPTPDSWSAQMLPLNFKPANTIAVSFLQPLFLPLLMTSFVNSLLVNLCTEKEKKIKDSMRVMGMMESAFWFSWGVIYWTIAFVLACITVIVLKAASLFLGDGGIPFLLTLLYFWSMVSFTFFLSTFFKKAKTAGSLGGLVVFILTFLFLGLYIPFLTGDLESAPSIHYLTGLLPPLAYAQTLNSANNIDLQSTDGMQFANITEYSIEMNGNEWKFSVLDGMIILIVDIILYFLMAIYFENIIPGTLGYRLKPYFFLLPGYWGYPDMKCLAKNKKKVTTAEPFAISSDVEPISREFAGKDALKIRNLSKVFMVKDEKSKCCGKKPKKAVNQLTMDMYEGQITCLLGHNGAGKTTTINILTGLMMPTSGGATYYGYDINSMYDLGVIRAMTGVCPQHDILFDNLTCDEHLRIFGTFKGIKDVDSEVERLLEAVLLTEKRHAQAGTLSGGQKRKLSVAIALIGNPKFVFLDEPSAGLDPYSRRALWDLLKAAKKDKVILLTTHFMDEADILSDRKAIIADGTLKCMGSSLFLKNRFGIGYHLNMNLFAPASSTINALNAVRTELTRVIVEQVPSAKEIRCHGHELMYALPQTDVSLFPELFRALDLFKQRTSTQQSGVKSYGVSMTSLEEVFFKIGEEHHENQAEVELEMENQSGKMPISPMLDSANALRFQRFASILWLRMKMVFSNWVSMIFIFLVPILMTILGGYLLTLLDEDPTGITQEGPSIGKFAFDFAPYTPSTASPSMYFDGNDSLVGELKALTQQRPNDVNLIPIDLSDSSVIIDYANSLNESEIYAGLQARGLFGSQQTIFYNVTRLAPAPSVLNWVSNIIASTGRTGKMISISNFPFPSGRIVSGLAFASIFFIASAVAITIPMHAASDMVKDRYFKTRNQLRIMGVGVKTYWFSVFTWDFICASIIMIIAFIVVKAFKMPILGENNYYYLFVILYILYMPLLILWGYFTSFMFDNIEKCQTQLPGLLIITSFVPFQVIQILNTDQPEIAESLHTLFCIIFPTYNFFGALFFMIQFSSSTDIIETEDVKVMIGDILGDNHVGIPFIMIILWTVVLCCLLPVLDGWKSNKRLPCTKSKPHDVNGATNKAFTMMHDEKDSPNDDDVQTEEERVAGAYSDQIKRSEATVLVKDLHKTFYKTGICKKATKQKCAVKKLNFMVEKGEIFGLLGPNGAGKSTTMNIITADCSLDSGEIFVSGHDIVSSQSDAFKLTGYCPQHNPLYDDLSVRTHLYVYASVRGVKGKIHIDEMIEYLLRSLKISEHADKPCKNISGGTKRKLCFAISLLGQPEIVLMDEPSTGMDPGSKRFLWDTIIAMFKGSGRGAILTTHSMEEADALCSRIAIMIQGGMKCIGSSQHIKDKHGSGYQLEVKLKPSIIATEEMEKVAVKDFIMFVQSVFSNFHGNDSEPTENFGEYISSFSFSEMGYRVSRND